MTRDSRARAGHAPCAVIQQCTWGTIAYTFFTNLKKKEERMKDHVYKQIELTGSSAKSSDDAIRTAIEKASKTLRNLHWFEVIETRGQIEDDKVVHWQVTIKVGLRIE
jgi:flavin-binding protein dodecin